MDQATGGRRLRVVLLSLALIASLAGCASAAASPGPTSASATQSPHPAVSTLATRPTCPDGPAAGRLTSVFDNGYRPDAPEAGAFRMDPAPDSLNPRISPSRVLATVAGVPELAELQEGERIWARFGLYTGYDSYLEHGYGAVKLRLVHAKPSWLIVVCGMPIVMLGPAPPAGTVYGWATSVMDDQTKAPHAALDESGRVPNLDLSHV